MSAPSKAYKIQLVEIQSKQSLTNSLESTSASVAVTKQMKPDSEMYQAATQVNVLSPVIDIFIEADVFHGDGKQYSIKRNGKFYIALSGSEAVA